MPKNETTTKFKVDISELKKGIQEANRQIRLANSEFKAATAGMDDWSKSADGVSAKITQLNSVLTAQKSKLENLEKQYELVVQEQGENSRGAEELRIKINNQKAVVGETEKQLRSYNAKLEDIQSASKETAKAEEQEISTLDKLKNKISEQENELEKLKDKYANVVLEQGNNSQSAQDLAREIETLSGQLNDNRTKLSEAEKSADEFDSSLENLDEEADNTANGGISAFGVALGGLIENVVLNAISKLKELVAESINVGMNFDSSMSKVAAVSGATEEEIDLLRNKAKQMGADTKFSASEAADAMNYMAMAGWKTEEMMGGIDGIMNLAAASGTDLAKTSDIVTDALTAMGYKAEDAGKLADVMAAASSNANTNVEMLGETFKYVAPVAGSLNYSMEDTAVAIGLMANSGIKSSQAGTALRSSLSRMVKPTKQMKDMMVKLGLATSETTKQIDNEKLEKAQNNVANKTLDLEKAQVKYNQAIEKYSANAPQIQIAMNSVETAQINLNKAISQYGENSPQAQKAAIALENAQTRLNDTTKKYSENAPEVQTATLNLQKAKNNLAEAEKKLKTEQEGSAKSTKFQAEILTDADGNMRSLADVMKILREKFKDLDADQQAQAAATLFGQEAMSGMLAIINTSDEDFNKLSSAIHHSEGAAKEMSEKMMDNLGGDMTLLKSKLEGVQIAIYEKFEPALRKGAEVLDALLNAVNFVIAHSDEFIAVLGGMATALGTYLAYTTAMKIMTSGWKSLTIVTKAQAAAQTILNAVMSVNPIGLVIAAIAGLVAAFVILWNKSETFRNFWIGLWEKIKKAVTPVLEKVKETFSKILTAIRSAIDQIKAIWSNVRNKFTNAISFVIDWIKKNWKTLLLFLVNPLAGIFKYMYGHFEGFRNFVDGVIQSVITFFQNLQNSIVTIWNSIVDWLNNNVINPIATLFVSLWENIKNIWNAVTDWFNELFTKVTDTIHMIVDPWIEIFKRAWNLIKETFTPVIQWFKDIFTGAWNAIKNAWSTVQEFFTEIWNGIRTIFSYVIQWFNDIFTGAWNAIKVAWSKVSNFFSGVWNSIMTIFGYVVQWFKDIFTKAWNTVKDAWSKVKEFFSGVWNGITAVFLIVGTWFGNKFTEAWTNIKNAFSSVKSFFSGVWDSITSVFSHIADWFRDKFTTAWENVKNVFSTGGRIFDGIKDGILNGLKAVINALISGINTVISVPFNGLNWALNGIRNIEILGVKPFEWINGIDIPQIPYLYRGGVLKKGQIGLLEGSGAEAVIPLEKNTYWLDEIADRLNSKMNRSDGYLSQSVHNSTVNNFYQTNHSPKALSRLEIYRQSKNLLAMKR